MGIIRVSIWVIGLLTYLLSHPDPPSMPAHMKVSGRRTPFSAKSCQVIFFRWTAHPVIVTILDTPIIPLLPGAASSKDILLYGSMSIETCSFGVFRVEGSTFLTVVLRSLPTVF